MYLAYLNHYMTKLKPILQSKYFYIISILIIILYCFINTILIKYDTKYNDTSNIIGTIIKVSEKENKVSYIIKNNEKILVEFYYYDNKPTYVVGDQIKVSGERKIINNPTIPNTFNYKNYLYNKKIYLVIKANDISLIKKNSNILNNIKDIFIKRINNNSYLQLFIMGDKSYLDNDIYNEYKNIGIAHLLAISGLHLGILVFILNKLLFFLKDNHKFLIITSILLIYAYIISFPPSFLRVLTFYILSFFNKKYTINLKNIQLLFICFFILLIINPFYLYDVGFEFSFITVFGIMLSSKYLHFSYIKNLFLITIISFLFTFPIVVNLNYEVNIMTFLVNIIMVPLVSFIIYPFALISFALPITVPVFNFLTGLMEGITNLFSFIDFTKIIIPRIPWFLIVAYYSLLIIIIYYNKLRYLSLIILLIMIHKYSFYLSNYYSVNFFDVGQGDSSLIISPNYKNITVIDTGGIVNSNYHPFDNILVFIKSIGIDHIDNLILTHGDYDHMGEAINLVNNFKVEKVIFNCGPYNDLEQELIKVLNKKHIKYYSCIKELNIDNKKLYFLQTKEYDNENDNSNVIITELDGYKFMFMGDASVTTEKEIVNKYNLPNIDVLKVGHHGSKTSSSKEFINEISPKYSVISVGKNNRYGHPNKEVLDNLNDSKIYRTDQDGSIMFKIKNNKLRIETCSP